LFILATFLVSIAQNADWEFWPGPEGMGVGAIRYANGRLIAGSRLDDAHYSDNFGDSWQKLMPADIPPNYAHLGSYGKIYAYGGLNIPNIRPPRASMRAKIAQNKMHLIV